MSIIVELAVTLSNSRGLPCLENMQFYQLSVDQHWENQSSSSVFSHFISLNADLKTSMMIRADLKVLPVV